MKRPQKTKLEVYFTSYNTVIVNSVEKELSYLYDVYNKEEYTIEICYQDKQKLDLLFKDKTIRVTYKKTITDKMYVADFETTPLENRKGVRVYAAAIVSITNPYDVKVFTNIKDFLDYVMQLPEKTKVYFHNLGFDGAFIVDYLFRQRETPQVSIFSRKWYSIRHKHIEFRDTMKLLPGTRVKDMPKQFNLPLEKLDADFDYKKIRKIGEKLTDNEIKYIKHDVTILGLTTQKLIEAGFNPTYLTIGSFVYALINRSMAKEIKRTHEDITQEDDQMLRSAYYGGYTSVNESFKGQVVDNITAIDYNSMYPSMMLYKPMPIGKPTILPKKTDIKSYLTDEWFVLVDFEAEIINLKPGKFPTLARKGGVAKYLSHFDFMSAQLVYSDFAWALKNYTFGELKIKRYIVFKATTGDFNEVINGLKTLKEKSSELDEQGKYLQAGVRTFAKLCLNNMYGKFAQKLTNEKKYVVLDHETDALKEHIEEEQELGKGKYLPIAIAVTAAARDELFKVYERIGYDRIVYSDTDSIYIKDYKGDIDDVVHPSDFGKWAIERQGLIGKFLHAKCYMLDYGKYKEVKVAGLPKTADVSKLSFSDFKPGLTFPKIKLLPKYVYGGIELIETDFTIKDIK